MIVLKPLVTAMGGGGWYEPVLALILEREVSGWRSSEDKRDIQGLDAPRRPRFFEGSVWVDLSETVCEAVTRFSARARYASRWEMPGEGWTLSCRVTVGTRDMSRYSALAPITAARCFSPTKP